jgi:uncharacterized BrkB/YihY/UPF0761 family membrane protein
MLIVIVCLGTGIGFLLHWIMPTVELGIGILIGVVVTGFCLDLVARIISSYHSFVEDDEIDQTIVMPGRSRRSSKRNK